MEYGDLLMSQVTKILQLTDFHLFGDQQTKLVGINPLETLQHVLAKVSTDILKNYPDLVILTGDISQDYSLESYKIVTKNFQFFQCPVVATMGNHDYSPAFTKVFGNPTQIVTKMSTSTNWRILILNSNWPKHVDGQLTDDDLIFLQKSLETSSNQPTIIFIHHHVLPIDSNWIDKINLHNAAKFLEIIDQYRNVKAVICGHVHQDTVIYRQDVIFLSTPSTSWQFAVKSPNFRLDNLMPGYRWINLYEDGTIQTEVVRIEHNDMFVPDATSRGY